MFCRRCFASRRPDNGRLPADPEAATFGTGFVPFFLPWTLFIGALIIWMLLTPLQPRAIVTVTGLGAL